MKRPLYTAHTSTNLTGRSDRPFTADDYARLAEQEQAGTILKSKESLLAWWQQTKQPLKAAAVAWLTEVVVANRYRNVLSLGAGYCVMEYQLKLALPADYRVVATDFNPVYIAKAQQFFPELTAATFDFFKDDPASFMVKYGPFDLAVFIGASLVMDDEQFVKLFSAIDALGVPTVIDFYGGFLDWREMLYHLIKRPTPSGHMLGYARSRRELRRLYRGSGWTISEELSMPNYSYVAVLR